MRRIFNKRSDITVTAVLGSLALLFMLIIIIGNSLAFGVYREVLTSFFGISGGGFDTNTNQYFERRAADVNEAYRLAQQVSIEAVGEGVVMLKNENDALPLKKGDKVSCFSQSSVDFLRGGRGSGSIDSTVIDTLQSSFKGFGIEVNPTLWNFYESKTSYRRLTGGLAQGTKKYEPSKWELNEVPYSQYTPEVKNSYVEYNDAAIVVIARAGCENGDLPRNMAQASGGKNNGSILELDSDEKDLLENVCANFEKVIVILNTANAVECGFLDEYDIDACLCVGGIGQFGMISLTAIMAGKLSPSGKLVDTFAYDAFSSPAMQNMGNFEYFHNGTETEHHYLTYAEGIYVGYKYYETRYEDYILGQGNAGAFDYDKTVKYPFGYGLSYTGFEWSDFKVSKPDRDGNIEVSLTVRNVGSRPGKDVVEIYFQAPYTNYDKEKNLEKAAINLVGYGKTAKLQKGDKEVVTIEFNIQDMKSYDAFGYGTYLLEGGDYYITAASDAHKAINNVLKAKNGALSVNGDVSFVKTLALSEKIYNIDNVSENEIKNLFGDCDGTDYHGDIKYLSRQDWSVMDDNGLRVGSPTPNKTDIEGEEFMAPLSDELKAKLELQGYAASGAPDEDFQTPVTASGGTHKLIEMQHKSFDDPAWGPLLDQLTVKEMTRVARLSGYKTMDMESVGKPYVTDVDGPQAFSSFVGDGIKAGGLPNEIVIASAWNTELARRIGDVMGELSLWVKATTEKGSGQFLAGWYAPAMNIHRTPFGGRNFEYFSEDGVLSAHIGAAIVDGASQRGVICFIKHFAMNEQERNRMTDNVTWTREQAARELYFLPFEKSVKAGARAVMTSYNRIGTVWTGGNYNLITRLLRNEWGFDGYVLTDYLDGDWENVDQMLAAGGDAALNLEDKGGMYACKSDTPQALTYLRRSAHHILYATVNSHAMNGIDGGTVIKAGRPKFYDLMIAVNVVSGVGAALCILFTMLKLFVFGKKKTIIESVQAVEGDVDDIEIDKRDGSEPDKIVVNEIIDGEKK